MKTSETHPIHVDFVGSNKYPVLNRLGMTFAPGKKERYGIGGQWNRDLEKDILHLKDNYRVNTLVSLVEDEELRLLGIEDLSEACIGHGIALVRFPIRDVSTPRSIEEFAELIGRIGERLCEGSTVAVHCRAGLGRTGLTAACSIVAISEGKIDGRRAIEMVRRARAGTVETREQEKFIIDFMDHRRSA